MMEDLSLHILDIAENAVAAGASRVLIAVNENEQGNVLTFRVTDNGRGMSSGEQARALDPFVRREDDLLRRSILSMPVTLPPHPALAGADGRRMATP